MRSLEKFRGKHGENPSVIGFPLERSERSADHLDFLDRLHMIEYHGERRDLKHKDKKPWVSNRFRAIIILYMARGLWYQISQSQSDTPIRLYLTDCKTHGTE